MASPFLCVALRAPNDAATLPRPDIHDGGYDKLRRKGKPHRVAVTAVARKLCHVVYAVMRDGRPYDPAK